MRLDNATNAERRIAKLARRSARIVIALRREGQIEGAKRFEALAIEICADIRRDAIACVISR